MAGLQHHRGKQADRDEHQLPGQTASVVMRQVHATEAGETGLDLIDAEKDEGDAEHDTPSRLALVAGEAGQHPENQQRQGQRTQADVLPGQCQQPDTRGGAERSEEHTSELQSLMRISYAVFCLKKKKQQQKRDEKYEQQKK